MATKNAGEDPPIVHTEVQMGAQLRNREHERRALLNEAAALRALEVGAAPSPGLLERTAVTAAQIAHGARTWSPALTRRGRVETSV